MMENLSISSFKRFLLRIFTPVIIVSACVAYLLCSVFEREIIFKDGVSGAYKTYRLTSDLSDNDIPIFGSSRAEGCFVPDIISENCFNYGMAGTGNYVWRTLLTIELEKNKDTPIIINIDYGSFSYIIGDISYYLTDINNIHIREMLRDEYNFIYCIPVIKYWGHFSTYLRYYLNSKASLTRQITKGGSFYLERLPEKYFYMEANGVKHEYDFKIEERIQINLIKQLSNTKRKVFFVIAPYYIDARARTKNIEGWDTLISRLDALENVYVLDYTNIKLDEKDYYDIAHLTYDGAVKFSEIFKNDMKKIMNN